MELFKKCQHCSKTWETREDFLSDSSIFVIGYQATIADVTKGVYLFNHEPDDGSCGTTLGVRVEFFLDLYDGPHHDDLLYDTPECAGHCAKIHELSRCKSKCKNAFVREILHELVQRYDHLHRDREQL